MKDLEWVRSLVESELQMQETGTVEVAAPFDPVQALTDSTLNFLKDIKEDLVEYTTAFNQLRGQALGGIKIYGISRTEADFMLFRNGYKLIFTALEAGRISIRFQNSSSSMGASMNPETAPINLDEDMLEARWGAFGEIKWTFDNLEVNPDHLVRYYLQRFIRESAQ